MDVVLVVAGGLIANAITAATAYLLWRINRRDTDTRAIFGMVSIGLLVALIGYSLQT